MKKKSLFVTDIDNTLFDWVRMWATTFRAFVDGVLPHVAVTREELYRQIRVVHRRHGTAEYTYLLDELPAVHEVLPAGVPAATMFASAIKASRRARRETTVLYPGVLETLKLLRAEGTMLVAYTESRAFVTMRRIRRMGLDGVLHRVYSAPDHGIPTHVDVARSRIYPPEEYRLQHTLHLFTQEGELKPNPAILLDILADVGAQPDEAVYIGDSEIKDVAMAQSAGVDDGLAKYGQAHNREEYELLRLVSHWTDAMIAKEKALRFSAPRPPSFVLENRFDEVLNQFAFGARAEAARPSRSD